MITSLTSNSEAPATLPLAMVDSAMSQIREQYLALPPCEQVRLQKLLEMAERLDHQLGELHLMLPLVQIDFIGLAAGADRRCAYDPTELLAAISRWDRLR